MKRNLIAAGLTAAMLFANTATTFAFGAPEDLNRPDEITLYTYYGDDSSKITVDGTLEMLKEYYPDLTIHIEHRSDADGQVLKTRAAVGDLPDIFEMQGSLVETLYKAGTLYPLDDAMEATGFEDLYLEHLFDVNRMEDGKHYCVEETGPQVFFIYYNTEVFDSLGLEQPKNFDEFKEVVTALKDNGIIPMALFGQEKWPGLQIYDLAVIGQGQDGGISALDDGTASITDPEFTAAAEKMEELVSLGLFGAGALNTSASQAFEQVFNGQAGMVAIGSWFFSNALDSGKQDQIDFFRYNPFTDAGKEEETYGHMSAGQTTVQGYGVSADSEYAEFLSYVALDFVHCKSIVTAKEKGAVTFLKEAVEPDQPRAESFQAFADGVQDFKTFSKFEWALNNRELLTVLEDASELLNTGNVTAEEYIQNIADAMAELE